MPTIGPDHSKPAVRVDINSPATVGSAIVLGTIGVLSFIVQPGLVQGFVVARGVSEAAANDLAFVEMVGIAAATILISLIYRNLNWRLIVGLGLALAVIGNVLSALGGATNLFAAARLITGLAEGALISLSFTIVGLSAKTERNLALYLVLLLSYGAVGLWIMPRAIEAVGLEGIFYFWAFLSAVSAITIPHLPPSASSRTEPSGSAVQLGWTFLIAALIGVLLYNVAIGIAWANLFLIGMTIRPDEQAIANALLWSQFVAIGGALTSVLLADRLGRWLPITAGIFVGAASIAILLTDPNYLVFTVAVCLFNFCWNMALPFILAAVGDMDLRGRMMTPAIAVQMAGLAFGPLVAARLLEDARGFAPVESTSVTLFVASFIFLSISMLAARAAGARTVRPAAGLAE